MFTTIGELVNPLMEYTNSMEMSIVNKMPFIRALLGSGTGYTKAYLYIIQTSEHRYSVCDSYDDLSGNRYFPSGSKSIPFIQERDIIRAKFSSDHTNCGDYSSVVNELTESTFFDHLYRVLFNYDIIRMNPKMFSTPLINIFTSSKIKRNIEATFNDKKCHSETIGEFINMVIKDGKSFNIGNLKPKDSKELIPRFKSIGIIPVIENNIIISATLERHK